MEKIQSAIAKARAERARRSAAPAATDAPLLLQPAPHAPRAAGAPAGPATGPETGPETGPATGPDAAWQALPAFRPDPKRLARQRIMTFEGGREAGVHDAMRTRLLQQLRLQGWRRVAITSPGPACGKTTLALNLAFSLARQRDQRTILAEVDLRRPGIARVLGLREPVQFSRVLEGAAPFADHALRHGTNLAIAANQGPARNPAELLQHSGVKAVLAGIEATYAPTVMLFDLPPMLTSDDVMAFVPHVDAVLLVAAAEKTTIAEIDSCERDLAAHTNVMGVVLNKCRFIDPRAGYGYY